jgi:hypothetical protein
MEPDSAPPVFLDGTGSESEEKTCAEFGPFSRCPSIVDPVGIALILDLSHLVAGSPMYPQTDPINHSTFNRL